MMPPVSASDTKRSPILGVLFLAALVGGGYGVYRLSGGGAEEADTAASATAAASGPLASGSATTQLEPVPTTLPERGPVTKTIVDRATRDLLRRRILAAWAESPDPAVAAAAKDGRFVPMPEDTDASAKYLQSVVREDFFPMAKQCYESFLARKDAGGTIMTKFKIVGDEKIGGIVEDVELETEGGLEDEQLMTCWRESFLSLSFRPPPQHDGWLTVDYPIVLSP
jgi:hypothetical protein